MMKTPVAKRKSLADRVICLVEEARQKVASVANIALVYTYYEVGRQIVEDEQKGKRRADYGKEVLKDLSAKLTERFGKGWSKRNLEEMRRFYLVYSQQIAQTVSAQSGDTKIIHATDGFCLSWSHYLVLMRIEALGTDPEKNADLGAVLYLFEDSEIFRG